MMKAYYPLKLHKLKKINLNKGIESSARIIRIQSSAYGWLPF